LVALVTRKIVTLLTFGCPGNFTAVTNRQRESHNFTFVCSSRRSCQVGSLSVPGRLSRGVRAPSCVAAFPLCPCRDWS